MNNPQGGLGRLSYDNFWFILSTEKSPEIILCRILISAKSYIYKKRIFKIFF